MNLSANQLLELVVAAANGPRPAPSQDKRQAARMSLQCPIRWRFLLGATGRTSAAMPGLLVDVSAGGVGIVIEQPLEEGGSFVVEMPRLGSAPMELLCLCCYCRAQPDGGYLVGGQYIAQWSQAEACEELTRTTAGSGPGLFKSTLPD